MNEPEITEPDRPHSASFGSAAAGAVAGVALVALAAAGWWLGGARNPDPRVLTERSAAGVSTPSQAAAETSPHDGAAPSAGEDARTHSLRAELAADPARTEARRELALRLLRQESFYGAFEEAGELLARAPDDVDGLFVVAAVRVRMGQPGRALPMLEKVLARAPDHVPALTAKGEALLKAGRNGAALETLRRALELSGGSNPQVEKLLRGVRSEGEMSSIAGS